MGVYIKGMEMPKSPVLFCIHPDGKVFADIDGGWKEYKAVPVPPHGRLIDADALMGVIRAHDYPLRAHFNSMDNGMFTIGIQQAVDESPTIIPAEDNTDFFTAGHLHLGYAEEGE